MVAVVSIPTAHLRDFVGDLRIRPRAKPVEVASVNRSTSASRYAFATSVARNAARESPPQVAIAASNSASNQAAASASALASIPMDSPLASASLYENKQ